MATNKPANVSSKIWAALGDVETPTDVKMETGWVAEVPKAQVENWVQNRQDAFNAHVNERGIAEWDATTDYIANKSYVQDSSGTVYRAVQNTGPSTVVQNPTLDGTNTYWTVAFAGGSLDVYTKGQADARFVKNSDLPDASAIPGRLATLEQFDADLIDATGSPGTGAKLVGWTRERLSAAIRDVSGSLNGIVLNIWEFAHLATGYSADGDPATWDWAPAIAAADAVLNSVTMNGGTIHAPAGNYGIGTTAVISGLGKRLTGDGMRATEFRALQGFTGTIIQFNESSYCEAKGFKIVGSGGASQYGLYMPYRPGVGVILQNRIRDLQIEKVATAIRLENPVHCSVEGVRTTLDVTQYGLHSEFVSGVGAGQGGTNLNLISCWFQADASTGTCCRINSNWQPVIMGCQIEHGRDGLVMRSVPGATLISTQFEDCGQQLTMQGCTDPVVISPTFDCATTPDLGLSTQSIINIDGGSGAKFYGVKSISDDKAYIDFLFRFMNASFGAYPTDVTIDGYSSVGNKGLSGDANVTPIRIVKGGAHNLRGHTLSNMRAQLPTLTSAPASPGLGEVFIADGTSWAPVVGGRALVIYSGGDVYTKVVNF